MGRRTRRRAVKAAATTQAVAVNRQVQALGVRMGFPPIVQLACADDDGSPQFSQDAVVLVPAGNVRLADGDTLVMDSLAADQVIKAFSEQGVDVPIDIDHATVHRSPGGLDAPAQGWIKSLAWSYDKGLTGKVDWTAAGARLVHHEHYRYLSPVVFYDSTTKRVRRLHSAGLTNKPAIRNMGALKAASELALLQEFTAMTTAATGTGLFQAPEQLAGEIKQLLIGLGVNIPQDADLQSTMLATKDYLMNVGAAAVADDVVDPDADAIPTEEETAVAHVAGILKLDKGAKPSAVVAAVERLAMTATASKGADMATLHEQLAGLQQFKAETQATTRVADAVEARKLNPNDEEGMKAAHDFATRSPVEFDNWTKWAPVVGPPAGSVMGIPDLHPTTPLDPAGDGGAKMLSDAMAKPGAKEVDVVRELQTSLIQGMTSKGCTKDHALAVLNETHPKIFGS